MPINTTAINYHHDKITNLKDWPILNFIPSELLLNTKKVCVFDGTGNKAIFILRNGDTYTLGFNSYDCLGISDENKLKLKKIDTPSGAYL